MDEVTRFSEFVNQIQYFLGVSLDLIPVWLGVDEVEKVEFGFVIALFMDHISTDLSD